MKKKMSWVVLGMLTFSFSFVAGNGFFTTYFHGWG